ncbi:MAG: tRNA epoxyqueuosine(34) reductase QueG [Chloroflexota bacterium]|nr:tRNA epoxyqueuosine(34) reductase QueG [Chloroflexota bacterium]
MACAEHTVKQYARELGFDLVGIAAAEPFAEEVVALQRLREGLMDGLPWYTEARVRRGCHPEALLPGARSIISVAMSYNAPPDEAPPDGELRGRVACYARGDDYHRVMKRRLRTLVEGLSARLARPIRSYIHVDDGPMLDRAAAVRAGLGWYGKNSCLLTPSHGSWVLLGQAVTNLALVPDAPSKKSCGQCMRCIQACPTGAIVAPGVIDNARCISYLTIENRGPIPRQLRPLVGDWAFGCDICQEVCPDNRKAAPAEDEALAGHGLATLEMASLLTMTQEQFQERFRGSAVKRARLVGLKRNACVVLGNLGDPSAVPALARALHEGEPLVRGHAAWALGRIATPVAKAALSEAQASEHDASVREELRSALEGLRGDG